MKYLVLNVASVSTMTACLNWVHTPDPEPCNCKENITCPCKTRKYIRMPW